MSIEPRSAGGSFPAILAGVVLVVIFALVGYGIYLVPSLSANDHYLALVWIGILAFVLSIASFIATAARNAFRVIRPAAYGLLAFAFVTLVSSTLLVPDSAFGGSPSQLSLLPGRVLALVAILIVLLISLAFVMFAQSGRRSTEAREDLRAQWRHKVAAERGALGNPSVSAPPVPANPQGPSTPPSSGGH